MLPAATIQKIRHIQLRAGYLATDALAGEYSSVFKGMGMEFDRVREYVPGDDVRTIDWNVTARMRSPFVKVYREERELTVMLAVDVSRSQQFGSGALFKHELAAELAAILAFLANKNSDKVGLIIFSDHVEKFFPPQKGRAHVWQIIRTILTYEPQGRGTDVRAALEYLIRVCPRRSLSFVVSDFWADGYDRSLQVAAGRHELVGIRIEDPGERQPVAGLVEWEDAETGERYLGDGAGAIAALHEARVEELTRRFRRAGADLFALGTDDDIAARLAQFLKRREKRPQQRRR